MQTLQRGQPGGDGAWDMLRHIAGVACQSAGAYLSGTYVYKFSNTATRTVKLHLTDDQPRTVGEPARDEPQAYFLTVPPDSHGVEVPMRLDRVKITGGFFHADKGKYEIFWDRRPFLWEPGSTITITPRHSLDMNEFRDDVLPWSRAAAEAAIAADKAAKMEPRRPSRRQPSPRSPMRLCLPKQALVNQTAVTIGSDDGSPEPSLPGLVIYTHKASGWVSGTVTREREDGTLEVESGSKRWIVQPHEQAALLPLPAPALSIGGTSSLGTSTASLGLTSTSSSTKSPEGRGAEATVNSAGPTPPKASKSTGKPTMSTDVTVNNGFPSLASDATIVRRR